MGTVKKKLISTGVTMDTCQVAISTLQEEREKLIYRLHELGDN